MSGIPVADPADPRIADYRNVPDPELLTRRGLFIAENRLVVRTLVASTRFRTRSVLVNDAAYSSMRDVLDPLDDRVPVYICPNAILERTCGYNVHRGCLAVGERPASVPAADVIGALTGDRRLVVLEALTNADNMGGVFRNALAFGTDAVVVGPRCCDPLYRKAIRVSIGASLEVPFLTAAAWPQDLHTLRAAGFTVVALTPAADAVDLNEFASGQLPGRIALLVGNEGEGLSADALNAADVRVRIHMARGVDSLNVSTATGIALHRLYRV